MQSPQFLSYDEIVKRILFIFIFLLIFPFSGTRVIAATPCSPQVSVDKTNNFNVTVVFDLSAATGLEGKELDLFANKQSWTTTMQNGAVVFQLGNVPPGNYPYSLTYKSSPYSMPTYCGPQQNANFTVPDVNQGGLTKVTSGTIEFSPTKPTSADTISATVKNLPSDGRYFYSITQDNIYLTSLNLYNCSYSANQILLFTIPPRSTGVWNVYVMQTDPNHPDKCAGTNVVASGVITIKNGELLAPNPTPNALLPKICGDTCATALGSISTDPAGFVKSIFSILLSLSGGVALVLIIISGYRLMSSQGNPERVQAAREQLTSAIVGLLFIIFSITILQIIGVDILHIPGLTK